MDVVRNTSAEDRTVTFDGIPYAIAGPGLLGVDEEVGIKAVFEDNGLERATPDMTSLDDVIAFCQAVFDWANATIDTMLNKIDVFPPTQESQEYRATQRELSASVLAPNYGKILDQLATVIPPGTEAQINAAVKAGLALTYGAGYPLENAFISLMVAGLGTVELQRLADLSGRTLTDPLNRVSSVFELIAG